MKLKRKNTKFIISFITLANVLVATVVPLTITIGFSIPQIENNNNNGNGGSKPDGAKPDKPGDGGNTGGDSGAGDGGNNGGGSGGDNGSGDSGNNGGGSGGDNGSGGGGNTGGDNNTNTDFDKINEDYLKDNKIDVIANGSAYSLATPGTGGNDSVRLSPGPSRTQPSPGIVSNQELQGNKIYNDVDVLQAKKTYSLVFIDGQDDMGSGGATHLGTGWILDFKLPDNNQSYPTTWYIGTNAHVIQNLKVKNDTLTPERYNPRDDFYNTAKLRIFNLNKFEKNSDNLPITHFGKEWNTPNLQYQAYKYYDFKPTLPNGEMALKTVFIGNDFLKTSPSMFSRDGKWLNYQEYADFAVMEVTFESEKAAEIMTNNYYNDKSLWFKYKKESILKNQDNLLNNNFSVLGYPSADPNFPWNTGSQLYTSRPVRPSVTAQQNNTTLGTSKFYTTFNNIKSAFDASLTLNYLGYEYRYANPDLTSGIPTITQYYNSWGLMYPVDYGHLGGGSSGSMLMDKYGYTWGIHFGGDNNASTGIAQALYCEGFNYQGKFGRYNLQGYDLIEGGFENQQNSYRDGLIKLYGNNSTPYKTNLFPDGINW